MSSTTYQNGQVLSSSALAIAAINAILQPMTMNMLGQQANPSSPMVRLQWPSEGAPFGERTEDVCYLKCIEGTGDNYDLIRDKATIENPADPYNLTVLEQYDYTRIWQITWCFYGPTSWDYARMVRSALYLDYFTQQLATSQLFPVCDFPKPVRVPELINGQWVERVDFSPTFYEAIRESITDLTVGQVEVIGNIPTGKVFDTTVSGG